MSTTKSTTKKDGRNAPATQTPQPTAPKTRKIEQGGSGWGPLALEPGQGLIPSAAQASAGVVPTKAPRKRKGRTLAEIMASHKRPDGKVGFTFRDVLLPMHVSGESLRAALKNPGRLSITSVIALAEMMGEDPLLVLADILAETKAKSRIKKVVEDRPKGIKPKADVNARSSKTKSPVQTASQKKSGK